MTPDDPLRAHGSFERHGSSKGFVHDCLPRSHISNCRDDRYVKCDTHQDRKQDRHHEPARLKFAAGFLRSFADRLKSCHEIGNDLQDEEH